MTQSVVARDYGGLEFLEVVERDVPPPGPGEVTVDVRAVGTNPVDAKIVAGNFGKDPSRLPLPLGSELAGVVSAAGEGAPFAVGDEVVVNPVVGAYAAQVTVPVSSVFPKPAGVGFAEAAGLLAVGTTAAHLLAAAGVRSGQTVLVHGAAGSVGSMTAQLALRAGATVIGTAAPNRHDALRALGVAPVAYGDGLADRVRAVAPQGVDVALDTIGTDEAVDVSWELLADRDALVSIASWQRAGDGVRMLGAGPGADPGTELRANARAGLLEALGKGELQVPVARTFRLVQAREALEFVQQGHAGGKVVLIP